MSLINILNMAVLDNPAPFGNPLQFEITFECTDVLEEDLEWRVIYVGSAESSSHDQILDELLVGPIPIGINKFILQTDAPDATLIPKHDLLGITVLLVTCSYRDQEFARIGYYVNNDYQLSQVEEEEMKKKQVNDGMEMSTAGTTEGMGMNELMELGIDVENLDMNKVVRKIVADKPRVTRFPIKWRSDNATSSSENEEGVANDDDFVNSNHGYEEDDAMDGDDVDMTEDVEAETRGGAFSSPFKEDNDSSSNIVSPDTSSSCLKDVIMGM